MRKGAALIIVLVTFMVLVASSVVLTYLMKANFEKVAARRDFFKALLAAKSCVNIAVTRIWELNGTPPNQISGNLAFPSGNATFNCNVVETDNLTFRINSLGTFMDAEKRVVALVELVNGTPRILEWKEY